MKWKERENIDCGTACFLPFTLMWFLSFIVRCVSSRQQMDEPILIQSLSLCLLIGESRSLIFSYSWKECLIPVLLFGFVLFAVFLIFIWYCSSIVYFYSIAFRMCYHSLHWRLPCNILLRASFKTFMIIKLWFWTSTHTCAERSILLPRARKCRLGQQGSSDAAFGLHVQLTAMINV